MCIRSARGGACHGAVRGALQKLRQVSHDLAVLAILMHLCVPAPANKDYSQYNYPVDHRDRRGTVLEDVHMEL